MPIVTLLQDGICLHYEIVDVEASGVMPRRRSTVEVLVLGRDARVAYKHARILTQVRISYNRSTTIFSLHKRGCFGLLKEGLRVM